MTHATTAGGKTARLSRERIVAALVELLEAGGVAAATTRSVGEALQVHPTALYRHFRDMDEVVREAADHILEGLADTTPVTTPKQAMDTVHLLCQRLRTALMGNCQEEIRQAEYEYAVVILKYLEADEAANRAKIRAETSPEFLRKREARDMKELVTELARSLKYLLRSAEEEMRLSR